MFYSLLMDPYVLFNIYGPRAASDDAERIEFKLSFYKILQKRWESLMLKGRRVIVVGDLNIAPSSIDRCGAGPDFENNEFRSWFRSLLVGNGGLFIDVFRAKHPKRCKMNLSSILVHLIN